MRMTFGQKLMLFPVFLVIRILWFIDDIGRVVRLAVIHTGRLAMYAVVVIVALTSFYVESRNTGITNIPSVFSPESPAVLGVIEEKAPSLAVDIPFPDVSAVSVYAVDLDSDLVLVDRNSGFKLAPASTTKLMTALIALDLYSLEDTLIIPEFCTEIEGLKAGFYAEDAYSVRDLLFSLLVNSSADAACALAIGNVPYAEFIALMNTKSTKLGLSQTSFTNPIGLDGANGSHSSSARDLYLLARYARDNEFIKEIVSTKEVTVTSASGFSTYLVNTNDLLWSRPGSVGIKTGQTEAAGQVLVYEYDLDDKNIIISLMHSSDRFGDTTQVLDWVLDSYSWPD